MMTSHVYMRCLPAFLCALSGLFAGAARAAQEIPVPPFHALEVSLPAEVTVRQGPRQPLQIEAEPAVRRVLDIAVRGGVLTLSADSFSTRQPVRVVVVTPELQHVHAGGTSSVLVDGWRATTLTARATGSSDLQLRQIAIGALRSCAEGASSLALSGKTENWLADARDSARIDAAGLRHGQARLDAGDAASIDASAGTDVLARARDNADIALDGRLVPASGGTGTIASAPPCR